MTEDRRVFTPLARSSYWWKGFTTSIAVERVEQPVGRCYGVRAPVHSRAGARCGSASALALRSCWRWPWGAYGPTRLSTCGVWCLSPAARRAARNVPRSHPPSAGGHCGDR